jgi:hypothetical protein
MYQGIIYSGIDTNEYTNLVELLSFYIMMPSSDSVVVLLSILSVVILESIRLEHLGFLLQGGRIIRSHKYKIISFINSQGEHSFENVFPDPKFEKTLLPPNTDPLNPESLIAFRVINDRDSRFRINDFPAVQFLLRILLVLVSRPVLLVSFLLMARFM